MKPHNIVELNQKLNTFNLKPLILVYSNLSQYKAVKTAFKLTLLQFLIVQKNILFSSNRVETGLWWRLPPAGLTSNPFYLIHSFFANACARSFYRSNPMSRARFMYTRGPHGFLSYFLTELLFPAVLGFCFNCGQGPSVTPFNKREY